MKKLIKLLKGNWPFFLIIICVILSCPFFVNFIVTTETPYGLGFINESNKDAWISFFGAIIGGAMTLIGVWWTIVDQNKKRKEELAIQFKPFIKFEIPDDELDYTPYLINSSNLIGYLPFCNIGRGEATNIWIFSTSKFINFPGKNNENEDGILAYFPLLPQGESTFEQFEYHGYLPKIGQEIQLCFNIHYSDLYNYNKIKQTVTVCIRKEHDESLHVFYENGAFT